MLPCGYVWSCEEAYMQKILEDSRDRFACEGGGGD